MIVALPSASLVVVAVRLVEAHVIRVNLFWKLHRLSSCAAQFSVCSFDGMGPAPQGTRAVVSNSSGGGDRAGGGRRDRRPGEAKQRSRAGRKRCAASTPSLRRAGQGDRGAAKLSDFAGADDAIVRARFGRAFRRASSGSPKSIAQGAARGREVDLDKTVVQAPADGTSPTSRCARACASPTCAEQRAWLHRHFRHPHRPSRFAQSTPVCRARPTHRGEVQVHPARFY